MKTLFQIEGMIEEQIESILELEKDKKKNKTKIKKGRNNLTYLREIKAYLFTEPKVEHLYRDKNRFEAIIDSKYANYDCWFKHIAPFGITKKKAEALFIKENNIDDMKKKNKNFKFYT